jgi:hypothetical protein
MAHLCFAALVQTFAAVDLLASLFKEQHEGAKKKKKKRAESRAPRTVTIKTDMFDAVILSLHLHPYHFSVCYIR